MKINVTVKTKHKDAKPASRTSQIFILGESPLVEEYAELCGKRGYSVLVALNNPQKNKTRFESKNIKTSMAIAATVSIGLELTNTDRQAKKKNLERLDKALPPTAPILSSSITVSATEQSSWITQKHRLVGIGAFPTFIDKPLVEVAPTVYSPKETLEVVNRFYASLGKEIELIQDRIGMVLPRILCQLINESVFALQEDVAAPRDIDTAMKLGANYPKGPFEWAETIGVRQVYAVLNAIQQDLNEDRYRISPLLKQMAVTGEWWKS
jgi:3-hydroxybutyryl-CoA dehydrogenase